jgi:hypothetical protein
MNAAKATIGSGYSGDADAPRAMRQKGDLGTYVSSADIRAAVEQSRSRRYGPSRPAAQPLSVRDEIKRAIYLQRQDERI